MIHLHTYTCTHIYLVSHICIHICKHIYIHAHILTHMDTLTHVYVHSHTCTHVTHYHSLLFRRDEESEATRFGKSQSKNGRGDQVLRIFLSKTPVSRPKIRTETAYHDILKSEVKRVDIFLQLIAWVYY